MIRGAWTRKWHISQTENSYSTIVVYLYSYISASVLYNSGKIAFNCLASIGATWGTDYPSQIINNKF